MKKIILFLTITTLSCTAVAEESSWFDSITQFLGLGNDTSKVEAENSSQLTQMVAMLSESLNIDKSQASGGLGAIFNYVKNNVSQEQFQQLLKALPGVDSLIANMPDLSQLQSSEGVNALFDKAAEYSDSLKGINDVKKQFEALGLKPEMIAHFISKAQNYLDSEQGQEAKKILTQGLQKM